MSAEPDAAKLSADPDAVKMSAEPDATKISSESDLSISEEQELTAFSKELFSILRSEMIITRKKTPRDSFNIDNIQVFSLAAGILSEEMLNILPGVINFTLHNFSTSNKIKYRKVGEHRVFLGPIDRVLKAGHKLMELAHEGKNKLTSHNEADSIEEKVPFASRPSKRKGASTWDHHILKQPRVESPPLAAGGIRTSSRLCAKPRRSYASLHTVGDTDDLLTVKVENESEAGGNRADDSIYEPASAQTQRSIELGKESASSEGNIDKLPANEEQITKDTGNELEDKPVMEKTVIMIKPPRKCRKSVPSQCDICFLELMSCRQLDSHRKKHFNDQRLTQTALALHIQGLTKRNKEENLTGELAEQVEAYRNHIKMGSANSQNTDNVNPFIVTDFKVVEVVPNSDGKATSVRQSQLPASNNTDVIKTNGLGVTEELIGGEAPKKKRGRKSNFEKGLPFIIKGKTVSGTESDHKVAAGEEGSSEGMFECDLCHSKLVSKQSLDIHIKNIHLNRKAKSGKCRRMPQEELKCPHCDFICFRTQNFSRHLKTHSNPDLYMCDNCNYTHKVRAEVLRHKRNAHAEKNFTCEHCGSLHRNQSLLNMHIKLKHTLEYSMVCETCNKRCSNKAAYKEHMARHASGQLDDLLGQIMCNLCARVLPSRSSFEQHKLKFHGDDLESEETRKMNEGVEILSNGTFQCRYCQAYINPVAREVRRHILRKHMDRKYQCDQCKASFPLEKLLVKHIRIVHYGLEKKKCPECNKWFRNNTYLTQHVKRVHSTEYQCPICKKLLSDKRTLLDHSEIHKAPQDRIYRFSCELCEKKFRFRSNYDYHMTEHTGKKPFPCTVCERKFRSKHILDRHLTTHIDDRPYVCDKCQKTFKLKKYLDAHTLTHSGNRHICNLCWKPFGSQDALSKHTCKSCPMKLEGDEQHPTMTTIAPKDDRIIQGEMFVDAEGSAGASKETVCYYMCAACEEGFVDVEEATGHICQTEHVLSEPKVTIIKQDESVDAVSETAATTPLSAILIEPHDNVLSPDALLENNAIDSSDLLPNQQFVLVEQTEGDLAAETVSQVNEELPAEMYMCGICNSLFSLQHDIQMHLQQHAEDLSNEGRTELLLPNDPEKQDVPTVNLDDSISLPTQNLVVGGTELTLILQDGTEQDIMLKSEEHDFIKYTSN